MEKELSLVWLTLLTLVRAKYGAFCNASATCDDAAPFCNIYFVDASYTNNMESDVSSLRSANLIPQKYGICVECLDDCDCDVNQYCGTDPLAPIRIPAFASENYGTGSNVYVKQWVTTLSASLSNLTIKSKCLDYVTPSTRCYLNNMDTGSEIVSQIEAGRTVNTIRTPSGWPKSSESEFCGKISSFGPAFYNVLPYGNQAGAVLKTEGFDQASADVLSTATSFYDFFNSPAVCPSWSIFKDSSLTCKSCLYGDNCASSSLQQEYCCSDPFSFDTQSRNCSPSSAYRSCQEACSGQLGSAVTSDINCASTLPASKYLTPAETASFCACVSSCESCVALAGGCGSPRKNSKLPSSVWGTCSGPCPSEPDASEPVESQPPEYFCPGQGEIMSVESSNGTIACNSYGTGEFSWKIAPPGVESLILVVQAPYFQGYSSLYVQSCFDAECATADVVATIDYSITSPLTIESLTGIVLLSFYCSSPAASNCEITVHFAPTAGVANRITTCLLNSEAPVEQPLPLPEDILTCQPDCLACLAKAAGCACPDVVPTFLYTPSCSANGDFQASNGIASINISSNPIEWSGYCERNVCKVCQDGAYRCTEGGISQFCLNGQWTRELTGSVSVELDPPLYQAVYASASFAGLLCLFVLAAGCLVLQGPYCKVRLIFYLKLLSYCLKVFHLSGSVHQAGVQQSNLTICNCVLVYLSAARQCVS